MVESVAACVYRGPGGSKQAGGRRHKYTFLRKTLIWTCAPLLVDGLTHMARMKRDLASGRSVFTEAPLERWTEV